MKVEENHQTLLTILETTNTNKVMISEKQRKKMNENEILVEFYYSNTYMNIQRAIPQPKQGGTL